MSQSYTAPEPEQAPNGQWYVRVGTGEQGAHGHRTAKFFESEAEARAFIIERQAQA